MADAELDLKQAVKALQRFARERGVASSIGRVLPGGLGITVGDFGGPQVRAMFVQNHEIIERRVYYVETTISLGGRDYVLTGAEEMLAKLTRAVAFTREVEALFRFIVVTEAP
jgi:hypothetical protein